jgi:hypothetical protein
MSFLTIRVAGAVIKAGLGFDHRVGHFCSLRMTLESSNASVLRC